MSIEYEFNSITFSSDDMEFTIGVVPQLEPFLRALPQHKQPPKRRYRRRNNVNISKLIDEIIDDVILAQ